jgi:orotidine-5'-phosphate decarboxylase
MAFSSALEVENPQDSMMMDAKERLIVALDLPDINAARSMVAELDGVVDFFKIGLTLQLAEGAEGFIQELLKAHKRVFLDYKYYDIPETVRQAVKRAAEIGVTFLTVHGSSEIMREAVKGRNAGNANSTHPFKLRLFTVTVLTSMDTDDIAEMGYTRHSVQDLVLFRARKAFEAGCDGVIASALEAEQIKKEFKTLWVASPGIRGSGSPSDDQKRKATPREAIEAGADYLVLGRLITDPKEYSGYDTSREAAQAILVEMQAAIEKRGSK